MKMSYFKEFIVLANVESYTLASAQLSMNESALSRHIKTLEKELGLPLFERNSRNVRLSPYGQLFLPYAKKIAFLSQDYTRELAEAKRRRQKTVAIGTSCYINDLIVDYHQYEPSVSLLSDFTDDTSLAGALRSGRYELGFFGSIPEHAEDFIVLPFMTDCYAAALPSSHPLASKNQIRLEELKDDFFISYDSASQNDVHLKAICQSAGFFPNIVCRADVTTSIINFIKMGFGISLLLKRSVLAAASEDMKAVAVVDIFPAQPSDIFLCWQRNVPLSDSAKNFTDFALKVWAKEKNKDKAETVF